MTEANQSTLDNLRSRIADHLAVIYPQGDNVATGAAIIDLMGFDGAISEPQQHANHWDESDVVVITYGDSILSDSDEKPLKTLSRFLHARLSQVANQCHHVKR